MNNLGDIFEKKLNQMGIKRQVEAALICEAFDKAILEVFGENGQKNVRAISFKNDTLKVGVASSAWAQEVCLNSLIIKNKNHKIIFRAISREYLENNNGTP